VSGQFTKQKLKANTMSVGACDTCLLLAASTDIMAQWKRRIRTYYPELLKRIDTNNGLRGELIQLQSTATFPRRAVNRIWVMMCNREFLCVIYIAVVSVVYLYCTSRTSCHSHPNNTVMKLKN